MNTERIIALLNTPSLLQEVEMKELQGIIAVYPFFNHARLLLTKKMQLSQHLLLKKEIKKTAVSIPNRKAMYEFLYQKEIQNSILESAPILESIPQEKGKETSALEAQPNNEKAVPVIKNETNSIKKPLKTPEEPEVKFSSFKEAVIMETTSKPESSFSKPIDLKNLGTENLKELDLLERQIIGQTIEHVLSQEIEQSRNIIPSDDSKEPDPTHDPHKFSEWLTILDQDRLKDWKGKKGTSKKPDARSIIDSFLQKDVKIISPKNDDIEYTPSNLARLSIVDDGDFVTETLANIYYTQGNIQKALSAYKKLLLKYPEKKTYFAARIEKLEKELK